VTEEHELLTPGEVAKLLRVDPKTVTRWARAGLIECIKTPGGHRRFPRVAVERFARPRRFQ
jgi:excisionase family DNA binding protein